MTFTYSGDPSTSTRNKVRFLINDTDSTDALFSDEELDYLITEWGTNVYEISRGACEVLIARFSRLADSSSKSVGDISVSETFSAKVQHYQQLADSFLARRLRKAPPTLKVNADSLLSTDDRNITDYNTDFHVGIHDNPNSNYESRVLE